MIVQELMQIQKRHGYLPHEELQRLSERTRVPLHRIHEVASFYPLYRLKPGPAVEVKVCRDMACHIAGAPQLHKNLEAAGQRCSGKVAVEGVSCLGQCDRPIAVAINDSVYRGKSEAELVGLVQKA